MQARVRFAPVRSNPLRRSYVSNARVRFVPVAGNPLRRSWVSDARNAGESAIWFCPAQPSAEIVRVEGAKCRREAIWLCPAQPSAEIVRVECAKCRRECDLSRSRATLCGDRACRLCSSTTTRSNLWSWKLRTGDFVVQLECTEYLGSWKMRTGDFLVQL